MSVCLYNVCRALQIKNMTLPDTSCECKLASYGFELVTELQLNRHSAGRQGEALFHGARLSGYLMP